MNGAIAIGLIGAMFLVLLLIRVGILLVLRHEPDKVPHHRGPPPRVIKVSPDTNASDSPTQEPPTQETHHDDHR